MCNNKITFIILVDDGNVSELEGCINSIENIPKEIIRFVFVIIDLKLMRII